MYDTQEKPELELYYQIRENEQIQLFVRDSSYKPNLLPEYIDEVLDKCQLKFMRTQEACSLMADSAL